MCLCQPTLTMWNMLTLEYSHPTTLLHDFLNATKYSSVPLFAGAALHASSRTCCPLQEAFQGGAHWWEALLVVRLWTQQESGENRSLTSHLASHLSSPLQVLNIL